MKVPCKGAIDCDLHPAMPSATALLPYLDDYWRDQIVDRHIDRMSVHADELSAELAAQRAAGLAAAGRRARRRPRHDPRARRSIRSAARFAICNVLHGAIALFNEDMAAALCSAVNDWVAKELLDREPRLRASILVPLHNPELAVAEIERRRAGPALRAGAAARRWARCCSAAASTGRSTRRPRSTASPIGIHAGSTYRHAPTASGWPSLSRRGLRRAVGSVRERSC